MPGQLETTRERREDDLAQPNGRDAIPPARTDVNAEVPEPAGTLHVVPCGAGWGIQVGSEHVGRIFRSREDAFRNAQAWAVREDRFVVLHGDGRPIEEHHPS